MKKHNWTEDRVKLVDGIPCGDTSAVVRVFQNLNFVPFILYSKELTHMHT